MRRIPVQIQAPIRAQGTLKSGLVAPSPLQPANLVADFEGATPFAVFDDPTAAPPTQDASAAFDGDDGAIFAPNLSTCFLRWRATGGTEQSIPAATNCWSLRLYWRCRTANFPPGPPANVPPSIVSVNQLTGADDFTFFYNDVQNRFQWDLDNLDLARSIDLVEPDHYYLIEARGDYRGSTWTADVRIDGIPQPSVASSGEAPTTLQHVQFGISSATQTWTCDMDDYAFAYGTSPLRFIGGV